MGSKAVGGNAPAWWILVVASVILVGAGSVVAAGDRTGRPIDATSNHPGPVASAGRAAGFGGAATTVPTTAAPGGERTLAPSTPPLPQPPACRYADEPAPDDGPDAWATTLVDTAFRLDPHAEPPDLVPVGRAGIAGGGWVRELVIPDLEAMRRAAHEAGVPLEVQSAYRSYQRQAEVFDGWVAQAGEAAARRTSARPGHSEHQLGTALDLRAKGGSAPWSIDFAATPTGRWLAANSWRFGFVLSYPAGAEDRTCYAPEPWHVRYVGRVEAAAVNASGVTLREWLWAAAYPEASAS